MRPDDVETFNFVLARDSHLKTLIQEEQSLRKYLDGMLATIQSLVDEPKDVTTQQVKVTADFLSRIADALLDSARESARQYPSDEPVTAAHE